MPVRMEAFGRVCVGMCRVRARRRRSVCVVALVRVRWAMRWREGDDGGGRIPEWIAYY